KRAFSLTFPAKHDNLNNLARLAILPPVGKELRLGERLMLRLDADRSVSFCDGMTRRDFLHAGSLAGLGLTLPGWMAQRASGAVADKDVNCIMLFLVGG